MINGRPFAARKAGPCPAGAACVHGGQIRIGDKIGPVAGTGWIHDDDRKPVAAPIAPGGTSGQTASKNLPQAHQTPNIGMVTLPEGTYTIRPADERDHVVIDVDTPNFGSFGPNTRTVSVHGSFAVKGRSGLRQARSWLGFGLVSDGRLSLYRNMRALIEARPEDVEEIDRHARAKVIRAAKAVRLMLTADADKLMEYGKAYASVANACFVCGRPLLDEDSQKDGLGPVCKKRFRASFGG